ncbi:hypothetical protein DL769_005452 [Monosporascus sp. CRB-8-3]|nr:hypothetical protein DL769_005452 [Monosporascus sp. CRB-8-3]
MKYSAVLSLAVAPMALAKSIRNVYPPTKRDGHLKDMEPAPSDELGGWENDFIHGIAEDATATKVLVIWAYPGGEAAATTTIHEKIVVTETVTEGAGHEATATATEAAPSATHTITVGGEAGLVFTPPEIQAHVGDMVIFTFMSQMHTATQSSFDTPCDPLEGGMDTGTQPNPNNTVVPAPQVAMQVMTTEPLWFYCKTGNHCGAGMVFSINPTPEKSHALFQAKAIEQKGEGKDSGLTGGDSSQSMTSAPVATSAPAATSAPVEATPTVGGDAPTEVSSGIYQTATGTMEAGACVCAVTCSNGNFPAMDAQGIGNFGGFAGGLPRSMMEAM